MKDFKYKIRASKSLDLITSCSKKVRNKLQWEFEENTGYSEALIGIAVEIYNKQECGFETPNAITYDLDNGNKNEDLGVGIYDLLQDTEMYAGYIKNKDIGSENFYATGRRDFGNSLKTIDAKNSTDKNVFDKKKYSELENKYVAQLNCYGLIYGTEQLELFRYLTPKSQTEIYSIVGKEAHFNNLSDEERDIMQERLETMYLFGTYPYVALLSHSGKEILNEMFSNQFDQNYEIDPLVKMERLRELTFIREVPKIENFEPTLIACVKKMNEFIEQKLIKN